MMWRLAAASPPASARRGGRGRLGRTRGGRVRDGGGLGLVDAAASRRWGTHCCSSWTTAPVIAPTSDSSVASSRRKTATRRPRRSTSMRSATLMHVGHVVADQHDGDAVVAHAPDHVQHVLCLDHAERGRGLVHDDHATCPRRGSGDGDALTLAAGEVGDGSVGVLHCNSKVFEGGLAAALHGALVEHAELAEDPRLEQLAAHVDVGGAVEVRARAPGPGRRSRCRAAAPPRASRCAPAGRRTAARRCPGVVRRR